MYRISQFLEQAIPFLQKKLFLLNACQNLILNIIPDQDFFENENIEHDFQ